MSQEKLIELDIPSSRRRELEEAVAYLKQARGSVSHRVMSDNSDEAVRTTHTSIVSRSGNVDYHLPSEEGSRVGAAFLAAPSSDYKIGNSHDQKDI